jgi:methionine-rich copper-binding protein CopC
VIAGLATASRVMAHANYESSTPAKGEVLSASPAQVSITFTQDVQRITGTFGIEVAGPAGAATTAPATLNDEDRSIMTVPLAPNLPPGRYVVEWKNVSDEDGDAAEGAFSFYIGVQPTAEQLAADAELAEIEDVNTPTPTTSAATPGTTPAGTTPPVSSTAVPPNAGEEDDGGSGTAIAIIISVVAVAAGLVIGFFGVRWYAKRRA